MMVDSPVTVMSSSVAAGTVTAEVSRGSLIKMDLTDPPIELPAMRRVLIVDDDPAMQRMVSEYLEEHGIRTVVANSRREMSRMLGASRFNLVLLDLRLGQEDGLDLLRELQAHADLPVIIMTAIAGMRLTA